MLASSTIDAAALTTDALAYMTSTETFLTYVADLNARGETIRRENNETAHAIATFAFDTAVLYKTIVEGPWGEKAHETPLWINEVIRTPGNDKLRPPSPPQSPAREGISETVIRILAPEPGVLHGLGQICGWLARTFCPSCVTHA